MTLNVAASRPIVVSLGVDTLPGRAYKERGDEGCLEGTSRSSLLGVLFTSGYALARDVDGVTHRVRPPARHRDSRLGRHCRLLERGHGGPRRHVAACRAGQWVPREAPSSTASRAERGATTSRRRDRARLLRGRLVTAKGKVTLKTSKEVGVRIDHHGHRAVDLRGDACRRPVPPCRRSADWARLLADRGLRRHVLRPDAGARRRRRMRAVVAAEQVSSDIEDLSVLPRIAERTARPRRAARSSSPGGSFRQAPPRGSTSRTSTLIARHGSESLEGALEELAR